MDRETDPMGKRARFVGCGRCIRRSPQGATATVGTRVYSWDAENRLVAVAPAVPAAVAKIGGDRVARARQLC